MACLSSIWSQDTTTGTYTTEVSTLEGNGGSMRNLCCPGCGLRWVPVWCSDIKHGETQGWTTTCLNGHRLLVIND
jgi:hypothetical protein